MNRGRTENGTAHITWYITWYVEWYLLCQHREQYKEEYTGGYVKHLPNPKQHTEKMKSCTVPVLFQYGAHSTRDGNSFQDHHTLCTSSDDSDSAAGKPSTVSAEGMQNTSWSGPPALCTCPQAAETGSKTRRLISLEKNPAPTQWKHLCERTPIDEARHSVTLLCFL